MVKKIFVTDWDDTILCSNLIYQEAINQKCNPLEININVYFGAHLRKLELEIIEYFEFLKKHGEIYIITNAIAGWVEQTCFKFFPELYLQIIKLKIISAPELFKTTSQISLTDNIGIDWKYNAMKYVLNLENTNCWLISVGDSEYEEMACKLIYNDMMSNNKTYNVPVKLSSIKLTETPTINNMILQLVNLKKNFNFLINTKNIFKKINL